ncbi:hypothetical protein AAVH_14092 [Aphelenchoides avenae]|nr:hypothetical protein AAVH_14092 [Aphelenchus avenae]
MSYGQGQGYQGYGGGGGDFRGGYNGGGDYGGYGSDVNFCPAGADYPRFCPSGSGWGRYCCQYQENGFWHGDCCVLPFGVGWLIAIIIVGVVILALVTWGLCACIPACPLAKRSERKRLEHLERRRSAQGRPLITGGDDYGVLQKEARGGVRPQQYDKPPSRSSRQYY